MAVGLTQRELRLAAQAGLVARIKHGWYADADLLKFEVDRHRLRTVAEVRDHRGSSASHHSAAVLHGLPVYDVPLAVVHLSLDQPRDGRRRPNLCLHGPVLDFGRRDLGVPAVSVALAVVQTASISQVAGLMAGDHALAKQLTTLQEIQLCVDQLAGLGGVQSGAWSLGLLDGRRESPPESRLAFECHLMGYQLEPQFRVVTEKGDRFADARIVGTWVLLEYDGEAKYLPEDPADPLREIVAEKKREDLLRDLGFEIVRVTKHALGDRRTLRRLIEAALKRARRQHGSTTPDDLLARPVSS